MAVTAGTRLGVFEITSTLGVGGMGEVYRAIDTRLKREVAIKILPESLATDPERLARFEREAELIASLNHPNIASVFGVEDTIAGKAMIMELVDGHDLRATIARHTHSVADALAIARQLANAIGAAHQRGIIHRDLKPANIMLRPDGTLKVLDFGLAKATSTTTSDGDTVIATRAGTIMGTPRYMSPEQARGELAGTQSDVWAFGVILYELLTGRPAFDAGSSAETLSKVLTTEPDFDRLPKDLSPRIKLLLQRCLRKNTVQRLHHIGDAMIEIEEAIAAPTASMPSARAGYWPQAISAVAIISLIGVGSWSLLTQRAQQPPSKALRADIIMPERLSSLPFGTRGLAISRDGSRIAVATFSALRVRRLDEADFTVTAARVNGPFFSPDGQTVAYFDTGELSGSQGLTKIGVTGGSPTRIAETDRSFGGDWRADGTIVFATTAGLFLVRDDGSQLKALAKPDLAAGQRLLAWPEFLPNSNLVQFTIMPNGPVSGAQIAVIDLDTTKVQIVVNGGSSARYVSSGHLIYASGQQLKRIAFDPRHPQDHGAETVAENVIISVAADNGAAEFAISDTGTLLFFGGATAPAPLQLSWIDRNGREERIEMPPGRYAYPRVSPDGTRIAADVQGANRDIWLYDLERRSLSQLSSGPTEDLLPLWSRDGTRVFWGSNRAGTFDIYSRAADGATPERLEFASPAVDQPISFSHDGTRLFVSQNYRDVGMLAGPPFERLEPVLHSNALERLPELSPDGKWLAYESNENGSADVFVRPFPDVETRLLRVSRAGGRYPLWNPAGNGELFYVTPDGFMMAATIAANPSLSVRTEKKLFQGPKPPAAVSGRLYDFSQKDGRFLVVRALQGAAPNETRLTLVADWLSQFAKD